MSEDEATYNWPPSPRAGEVKMAALVEKLQSNIPETDDKAYTCLSPEHKYTLLETETATLPEMLALVTNAHLGRGGVEGPGSGDRPE